jgi:hypothetical protein
MCDDDSICRKIVGGQFDAVSTYIESRNKAHTYLVANCVSATIKLTEKHATGKNGIELFANKKK